MKPFDWIRKHHERGKISDALRDAALKAAEKLRDDSSERIDRYHFCIKSID